jgi:peptide/nickel transport system ATP-binding protein
MRAVVEVSGLTAVAGESVLLDGVDFAVREGRTTALVGPSGSGKTTAALALLGEAGPGVRITGNVVVDGNLMVDVTGPAHDAAAQVRGRVVAYLPQHPGGALNPARRIGAVLTELSKLHKTIDPRQALEAAQLPTNIVRRFPHQFSGGQRQRIALAQALVCGPRVLVLDEPSTGLDSVTRMELVSELRRLVSDGLGLLLLSHDHEMVHALADHVVVLRSGKVVDDGPATEVLPVRTRQHRPTTDRRVEGGEGGEDGEGVVVRVEGLTAWVRRGRPVLEAVDLELRPHGRLGVVGRSGSGKTTLARCIAGLHERYTGRITLDEDGATLPVLRRRSAEQVRRVQYVWQEVRGSFDDRRPVHLQVARTAVRLRSVRRTEAAGQALALLDRLGVGERTATRTPGSLSGGELQRAALARALLAEPDVLICDEITTALDDDATGIVLDVLDELGTALIWIGHDLGLVAAVADEVLVLDAGRVVEYGSRNALMSEPQTPAARRLLRAAALGRTTPPATTNRERTR